MVMKVFNIKHQDAEEVKSWLTENFGPEDTRWWVTNSGYVWNGSSAQYNYDLRVYVEATEDEEPWLTVFTLRWV